MVRGATTYCSIGDVEGTARIVVFTWSEANGIAEWGKGAQELLGWSAEEVRGRQPWELLSRRAQTRLGHQRHLLQEKLKTDGLVCLRASFRTKQGCTVACAWQVERLAGAHPSLLAVGLPVDHSQRSMPVHRSSMQQLRDTSLSVLDRERIRIANDLHDRLAQELTLLRWRAEALLASKPDKARTELLAQIDRMSHRVRRMVMELLCCTEESVDLVEGLQHYAQLIEEEFALHCTLELDGSCHRLTPEQQSAALKIACEALINVVRHAQADHVRIKMQDRGDIVRLVVKDDGVGMRYLREEQDDRALGLQSMTWRAEQVGGELRVEGTPGQGTKVVLTLKPEVEA